MAKAIIANGIVIGELAPFKGICKYCGKRTVVRHYPYNIFEWLGTFCKPCFEEISKEISEGGLDSSPEEL